MLNRKGHGNLEFWGLLTNYDNNINSLDNLELLVPTYCPNLNQWRCKQQHVLVLSCQSKAVLNNMKKEDLEIKLIELVFGKFDVINLIKNMSHGISLPPSIPLGGLYK